MLEFACSLFLYIYSPHPEIIHRILKIRRRCHRNNINRAQYFRMINIDSFISRNFPHFHQQTSFVSKSIRLALRFLFHEKELVKFSASYPHLKGFDFVHQMLDYFSFSYSIKHRDHERIPSHGRVVIIANHPIGTLDSAALLQLIGEMRRDVKIVTNEMIADIEPLRSLMLPVNNMQGASSKVQLKALYQHLEHDGAVIIFPAGEVSRMSATGIKDGNWHQGFLKIAMRTRSPILPIFIDGRNSAFFYALSFIAKPLSTLWLIREMFKQSEQTVSITVGNLIPFESYQENTLPLKAKVKLFKKHLYRIARNKSPIFDTCTVIAHPEKRDVLREEIKACELLGETWDHKSIYLFHYHPDCSIMREIGRLRELSFRAVGEGTGMRSDTDSFDCHCSQILVWDDQDLEIVGAYRMSISQQVLDDKGISGIYTHSLFHFDAPMDAVIKQGLELGRSFVQPKYWGKRSLDYLWFGIGAYLRKHPEIRYLYGPVSISGAFPSAAKDLLVYFFSLYFPSPETWATARMPYRLEAAKQAELAQQFSGSDYKTDFRHLRTSLRHAGCSIPTLYKQYSELCETGGVHFIDFNIDPDFSNCLDALVIVDVSQLLASKRERYIGTDTSENE